MQPILRKIVFVATSLVVGTFLGMLVLSTVATWVFVLFTDARWNWAIGFGFYFGAIPGAAVGFVSATFFSLLRIEFANSRTGSSNGQATGGPIHNGLGQPPDAPA